MMRLCIGPGPPHLAAPDANRCDDHRAQRERRRGSPNERGYDARHRALRAAWEPKVATGAVMCWRCGERIKPGDPWDLGHDDHDPDRHRGPEHANRCNRAAGGRSAHR